MVKKRSKRPLGSRVLDEMGNSVNVQWKSDPGRRQWKMIHLLYLYGKPGLNYKTLWNAGVDCQ